MRRTCRRPFLMCCAAVLTASAAPAATPEQAFEDLFGERVKQARATSTGQDDAALAAKVLAAAQQLGAEPATQALFYEKAVELGSAAAEGLPTATRALDLLEQALPKQEAKWRQKRLELYRQRYRLSRGADRTAAGDELAALLIELGDEQADSNNLAEADKLYREAQLVAGAVRSPLTTEIRDKIAGVARRQRLEQTIARLKDRLKKGAADTTARETLIRLYLLDMDDPAEAAKLLTGDVKEALRTYVPLAAKDVDEVPLSACVELAEWYTSLSRGVYAKGPRIVAYSRARTYYRRFLDQYKTEDPKRLKVKLAARTVEKVLSSLSPTAAAKRYTIASRPAPVDTGFRIEAGRFYELSAVGKWSGSDGVSCGPEGTTPAKYLHRLGPPGDAAKKYFLGQHPRSGLIGRIGNASWDFYVGAEVRFLAPRSGSLWLGVNDLGVASDKRAGRMSVTVRELKDFSWRSNTGTFMVEARIDSDDLLHVKPDGMYWEHKGGWSRVGCHDGFYPTVINSVCWWPDWPSKGRSAVLESTDFYPPAGKPLKLLKVAADKGKCEISKTRSKARDIVLHFSDSGGGSSTIKALYSIR